MKPFVQLAVATALVATVAAAPILSDAKTVHHKKTVSSSATPSSPIPYDQLKGAKPTPPSATAPAMPADSSQMNPNQTTDTMTPGAVTSPQAPQSPAGNAMPQDTPQTPNGAVTPGASVNTQGKMSNSTGMDASGTAGAATSSSSSSQ